MKIDSLETSLKMALQSWARTNDVSLADVRMHLNIEVTIATDPTKTHNLPPPKVIRTDEPLTDEDWEIILSLHWSENLAALLKEVRKKNTPEVTDKEIKGRWEYTVNIINNTTKVFKNANAPYRFYFSGKNSGGISGTIRLYKVKPKLQSTEVNLQ